MPTQRLAICAKSVLFLAGCSGGAADQVESPQAGSTSAEPSPTPTVFEQQLDSVLSGDPTEISVSVEELGQPLRSDNLGISFGATDLADPRLDPDSSNLDEPPDLLAARHCGSAGTRSSGERSGHRRERRRSTTRRSPSLPKSTTVRERKHSLNPTRRRRPRSRSIGISSTNATRIRSPAEVPKPRTSSIRWRRSQRRRTWASVWTRPRPPICLCGLRKPDRRAVRARMTHR